MVVLKPNEAMVAEAVGLPVCTTPDSAVLVLREHLRA
jgi:hypothetical protein